MMFMVSIGHILSTCLHACGTGTYGGDPVRSCMTTCVYSCICSNFDSKTGTVPSIWSVGTRMCTCMDRTYIGGQ